MCDFCESAELYYIDEEAQCQVVMLNNNLKIFNQQDHVGTLECLFCPRCGSKLEVK